MESCTEYSTSMGLISVALSPPLSSSITSLSATGDGIVPDDLVPSLSVSDDGTAHGGISDSTISLMPEHATTNSINENGDRCITFQVNLSNDSLDENQACSIEAAATVREFDVGDKSITGDIASCDKELKDAEVLVDNQDLNDVSVGKCDLSSPQLKQMCYQFVFNPDSNLLCLAEYDLGKNPPMLVVSNSGLPPSEAVKPATDPNSVPQVKPAENENVSMIICFGL